MQALLDLNNSNQSVPLKLYLLCHFINFSRKTQNFKKLLNMTQLAMEDSVLFKILMLITPRADTQSGKLYHPQNRGDQTAGMKLPVCAAGLRERTTPPYSWRLRGIQDSHSSCARERTMTSCGSKTFSTFDNFEFLRQLKVVAVLAGRTALQKRTGNLS